MVSCYFLFNASEAMLYENKRIFTSLLHAIHDNFMLGMLSNACDIWLDMSSGRCSVTDWSHTGNRQ